MNNVVTNSTIAALQTAVSPVILISGVGLLLLTMTNRLGRAIDRVRSFAHGSTPHSEEQEAQIQILLLRAELLRRAILCACSGALLAGVLVIVIFLTLFFGRELGGLVGALFILCMASIILSLAYFIRDVNLSLKALHTKLKR